MSSPAPPSGPVDPQRAAANRRMGVFVTVFILLLAGSLALVLREEKRRGILIPPTPTPPESAPAPRPVPVADPAPPRPERPAPALPASPALKESVQMERALVAFREAGAHLNAQRFDQAEDHALEALRLYPNMAAAQRILGLIYLQQGRIDRAISVLEASLRNEPFQPEALTNLAFAYLQAQNPGLALELIETCRRLHPDYQPALLQHGLMLLADPGSTEAVEVLREAVAAFPGLPGPRNNLAVALARTGDRAGAREQLALLLERDPDNFSALFNMGALHAAETNAPAAIPWLRRAMDQTNPAEFRRYLNDPDLAPIRDLPEFQDMLQELDPILPPPPPPQQPF
ncbi:MAG: tetratricopeptide repeat protein [Kiritimatiellia bacterium]|nr:tetratricopeptide repeat protein [Kiritimatiellia bacterium]